MIVIPVTHYGQWRDQARELLKRGIKPHDIAWQTSQQTSLFDEDDSHHSIYHSFDIIRQTPAVPAEFFSLAKMASCFRDPERWALLYSVAWRLVYEDRNLLRQPLDPQISRLQSMRKAVGRDKHKMEAFVRFRKINGIDEASANTYEAFIAWFKPDHLILPITAPFFVKRFYNMHWSIMTPDGCIHWDTNQLSASEGVASSPTITDELETLWLEYYKNIFNPARLKLKAMQSEMPKKYWHILPEASLIKELTQTATQQMEVMIDNTHHHTAQKHTRSRLLKQTQQQLQELRKQSEVSQDITLEK